MLRRNQFYFSPEGDLLSDQEFASSFEDEQIGASLTPPEKYLSSIPSFQVLFSVPQAFIFQYIRNSNEVTLLLSISRHGAEMDCLFQHLIAELQLGEILERNWKNVWSSMHPLTTSMIPILGQTISTHFSNINTLVKLIKEKVEQIVKIRDQVEQYVEMNQSLSNELQQEGCHQLANDKKRIAEVEKLLQTRLSAILTNNPYSSFVSSWDHIVSPETSISSSCTSSSPFSKADDETPHSYSSSIKTDGSENEEDMKISGSSQKKNTGSQQKNNSQNKGKKKKRKNTKEKQEHSPSPKRKLHRKSSMMESSPSQVQPFSSQKHVLLASDEEMEQNEDREEILHDMQPSTQGPTQEKRQIQSVSKLQDMQILSADKQLEEQSPMKSSFVNPEFVGLSPAISPIPPVSKKPFRGKGSEKDNIFVHQEEDSKMFLHSDDMEEKEYTDLI